MCVCVCVRACVCLRERERERVRRVKNVPAPMSRPVTTVISYLTVGAKAEEPEAVQTQTIIECFAFRPKPDQNIPDRNMCNSEHIGERRASSKHTLVSESERARLWLASVARRRLEVSLQVAVACLGANRLGAQSYHQPVVVFWHDADALPGDQLVSFKHRIYSYILYINSEVNLVKLR